MFASSRDGEFDICAMNDDGSNVVQLTDLPGQERRPRWSPDGTRIAFDYVDQFDQFVYLMNADGSAIGQAWPGRAPTWSPDGEEIAYSTPPARSPDGTELLFVHDNEILRIEVGGGSPHVVVAGPGSDPDPDWR